MSIWTNTFIKIYQKIDVLLPAKITQTNNSYSVHILRFCTFYDKLLIFLSIFAILLQFNQHLHNYFDYHVCPSIRSVSQCPGVTKKFFRLNLLGIIP